MLSGLCAQTNTKEKRFPLNNDMPNNSNYIYLLFRTCELGGCKDEKFKRYTCILLIQLQVKLRSSLQRFMSVPSLVSYMKG